MINLKAFYPLIAIAFISCKSNPNPPGTIAALNIPSDTADTDTAATPSVTTQEFSGRYLPGSGQELFLECQGNKFIIQDENRLLKTSYQKNLVALSYPDESAIVKIAGHLRKSTMKAAADTLVLSEVKELRPKSFQSNCYNYEFIGLGNEPFWSLEIIPDENTIAVKDVAASKAYRFPYTKPQFNSNSYVYKANNENETLEITIKRENCNDGMSDRNYNYSATIVINGKPLSGCAIKNGDKP